jgi:diacylglycerol kinase (ATP)
MFKKIGDQLYLFIINNHSGKGTKVWKQTLPLLLKMGIEFKSYLITKPDDLVHLKLDISSRNIKALVIIGGDGTIHHALRFIENTQVPLGIIPAGSGNDFARALKIPKNSKKALRRILDGQTERIDLIKVNDELCTTIVGVGFDAKVAEITNQSQLKPWLNTFKLGKLAYVFGVLKGVFSYQPTDLTINIDGKDKVFSNVWLIAIANTPYYGGGLKICPEADKADGIVNICIAHSLSRLELLMFFPLVFLGKHTLHRCVATEKGEVINISSKSTTTVQADGEMLGNTPISITVLKNHLNVIM